MHLERSRSHRQLRRVLNATDPTAKIIIPAESMFVFNGTSADLAQQFYQRYQAGDSLGKLDIPHKNLPATIQQRLATYKLKFKNLHSLLQRALLWDSGYVLDETARLVKIYTANGTSMADIAVSYQAFTEGAGCSASNCSSSAYHRSGAKCNGDKLTPVLKCASDDAGGRTTTQGSFDLSLSMSFWATGGNHRAIPELSITQHTWEDAASNRTYSVNAIHSIALADERSSSEDCSARLPSMIIPCARYTEVSSSGPRATTTTWGEPAPGKLVTVWLEHAHADRPGFSTTYTVLIVVGIVVGLVLLIVMCCKGKSRFKKRRQRRAEAKMTSADPQAFLDSSNDEVLEVSAVPFTPVHAILESAPSSTSSEWNNAFVSHRAVAGKRLRMDQLVLKKVVAQGDKSEIWAAKYHGARVAVKKIIAETETEAGAGRIPTNHTTTTTQHTPPEFSAEIELLASLHHRNIVRFYGVAWDSPDSLCVITEYARKGNLQDVLMAQKNQGEGAEPVLTWNQIKHIMAGVASALQHLHARQEPIVHGNLHAKNVLLSSHFEPKLIGIGAGTTTSQSAPHWRAPEVVQGAPSSLESDIYALGALFTELIAYNDKSSQQKQSEVEEQKQGDESVGVTSCSQAIKDVIAQCVETNPSVRPRVGDVIQALQQQ